MLPSFEKPAVLRHPEINYGEGGVLGLSRRLVFWNASYGTVGRGEKGQSVWQSKTHESRRFLLAQGFVAFDTNCFCQTSL